MKNIFHLLSTLFLLSGLTAQDGELDLSFNGDGKYTLDLSYNDAGRCVALQDDDKILIGGYTYISDGDMLITRLDEYGNPDFSFGDQGIALIDYGGEGQEVNKIHAMADDKILVMGNSDSSGYDGLLLARLMPNGDLDYSFGDSGVKFYRPPHYSLWSSMAVMANGNIAVAGYSSIPNSGPEAVLMGFTPNGSLNLAFGDSGIVRHKLATGSAYFYEVIRTPENKILAVGRGYGQSDFNFMVTRFNADGSYDQSFAGNGFVTIPFGGAPSARSVCLQKDGKILLAGQGYVNGYTQAAVVRLHSNGLLDQSFGTNGTTQAQVLNGHVYVSSVAVLGDGRILVAGTAEGLWNDDFALIRFNTDGSLDNTFHYDGIVTKNMGSGTDNAADAVVQPNGRIVIVGTSDDKNSSSTVVSAARFLGGKGNISLADFVAKQAVEIFPQPASDWVRVVPQDHFRYLQLRLYDQQSRLVKEMLIQSSEERISLEGLAPGLYMLQLVFDQHQPQYRKLLINN